MISFRQRPGLVVYLTCGDPDIENTREIALACIDAGADVLELGVPFSDPVADGPVIQRASERALKSGTSLMSTLVLGKELRRLRPDSGMIVFSYLNPILRFGLARFADELASAGIDGALVTDLTIEEAGDYLSFMRARNLATVFLAAPTSTDERVKQIANLSRGFVYAVSRTGVTGERQELATDAGELVSRIRRFTSLPVAVGFGISTAAQFQSAGEFADGVVVGSAIVSLVEKHGARAAQEVGRFVRDLRGKNAMAQRER